MGTLSRIGNRLFDQPAVVLYDGSCTLCRRSVRVLKTLDLLDQVVPVNALEPGARQRAGLTQVDLATLMQAMHVVSGERIRSGFEACRLLAGRVPPLWPLVPFLYLWPVTAIGRRVYRWVAENRTCAPDIPHSTASTR
jgi:predicted DCC family thiol-disulfide oxidoreductase YuxK